MKYRLNKDNYHNFNIFELNCLKPRSYFIPYPTRESADAVTGQERRYGSSKVRCLNGEWDFIFYPRPAEMPAEIDTDELRFDRIDVPSCWEFRGCAKPFYLNSRYQFPCRPPKIPTEKKVGRVFTWLGPDYGFGPRWRSPGEEYNYAGIYRRYFTVEDTEKKYTLSFLGVASCADVYLNGSFTGYTEGSHNTAEFDITPLVREGANELLVVVRRWCSGSYLECQDMFRNTGIFRDVLLRISEPHDVWDIDFHTKFTSHGYRAVVTVDTMADTDVTVTIEGHGLYRSWSGSSLFGTAKAQFNDLDVTEWSAEDPVLYDLYVEVPGSCVKMRVGFRQVEIRGDVFKINGRKVKLHGVNHHDTDSRNGYAMTAAEIERDMRLCKEYNVDTVRTSHYPPDPYLLEVCDELGIYVVDECDIETHGVFFQKLPPNFNRISNDPKWAPRYMDRVQRLYGRDRTHACIIMWSLGNEAGGGCNTDRMYDWLKAQLTMPVHYEGAVHTRRKAYDVASEMYPPAARLHEVGEKTCKIKEFCDRPYFLCEYAHAMGVGPGGMEAYWQEIYNYDNLMGGCVWEMNDHAVLHSDGSYTYGGDHGEWEHDMNFCVDGLFYPDRTPSTGARIMKFVYRPLRIKYLGGDRYEVFNTMAFSPSDRYALRCIWSDGSEETVMPRVKPLERGEMTLRTEPHLRAAARWRADCLLTIYTIDTKTGREAAVEQLALSEYIPPVPGETGQCPLPEWFSVKDGLPEVRLGNGMMTASAPYTILFRAPTDNDYSFSGMVDNMASYSAEREEIISTEHTDRSVTVTSRLKCGRNVFTCTDIYEACSAGVAVTSRLHCVKGKGDLPRFGKAFRLDESYKYVCYRGRNGESYADMKDQAQISLSSCQVSGMTEPNIRPQESGNRCDTRMAAVTDCNTMVTFTALERPFELGIKPYSDRALLGMKHREDEKTTGTYVTISAFQQGIGTGICGPKTAPEYCYPAGRDYEMKFMIRVRDTSAGH